MLQRSFLAGLFLLFAGAAALASSFPGEARWLPLGSALPGMALVIWCAFVARWGKAPAAEAGEDEAEPPSGAGFRHLMWTLAATIPVAAIGGFLAAVPVCYLTFCLQAQGRRGLRAAILTSAVATAVVWLIFGQFLGIPLSHGVFS